MVAKTVSRLLGNNRRDACFCKKMLALCLGSLALLLELG
jgi:hypothetical protein